jgi:hypothetical protein
MLTDTIDLANLRDTSYESKRALLGEIFLEDLRAMQMQSRGFSYDNVYLNGSSKTTLKRFLEESHYRI